MVFLVTDGKSNINAHLTVPNADKLKGSGVEIYMVAVGDYIRGIDEMVKVASYPPDQFLFRVNDYAYFWNIAKLIVKKVYPGKYSTVNFDLPC